MLQYTLRSRDIAGVGKCEVLASHQHNVPVQIV
jgi:hypothetical protein